MDSWTLKWELECPYFRHLTTHLCERINERTDGRTQSKILNSSTSLVFWGYNKRRKAKEACIDGIFLDINGAMKYFIMSGKNLKHSGFEMLDISAVFPWLWHLISQGVCWEKNLGTYKYLLPCGTIPIVRCLLCLVFLRQMFLVMNISASRI